MSNPPRLPTPRIAKPGIPLRYQGWKNVQPENAVWKTGESQWALGLYMICETVKEGSEVPKDAVAAWKDNDGVQFCFRPRPSKMPAQKKEAERPPAELMKQPGDYHDVRTSMMGVFRVGQGVLVKAKSNRPGDGGTNNEVVAMELVRKHTPQVPVPEVLYSWDDLEWECFFTVMREVPGVPIYLLAASLEEEHLKRLLAETARLFKTVGSITSQLCTLANGQRSSNFEILQDTNVPMTPVQLYEFMKMRYVAVPAPTEHFHLCHMDASPKHVFVAYTDGTPAEMGAIKIPPERQSELHVSGIIDWERANFMPRWVINFQFRCDKFEMGKDYHMMNAALVEAGVDDMDTKEFHFDRSWPDEKPITEEQTLEMITRGIEQLAERVEIDLDNPRFEGEFATVTRA